MEADAFNALERTAWEEAARPYAVAFGSLTSQAIGPLLDALGVGPRTRLLDVACGPGWLAASAAQRGAPVVGIDMSQAMLAEAAARNPGIEFRVGDAENLPFRDQELDVVAMNFGLLHLGRPEAAIAEAFRVLRAGGRFGFTVWALPDEAKAFGLILSGVAAHGEADVGLPAGPPFFRFSDPAECRSALAAAGFAGVQVQRVAQTWQLSSAEALFDAMYQGTARTRALLRGQTPQALAAIRIAVTEAARAYERNGSVDLPMPAVLATGTRN
jgi:SAM-dependent methyltransferase